MFSINKNLFLYFIYIEVNFIIGNVFYFITHI